MFDITSVLATHEVIKAGEKEFTVNTDVSPVVLGRLNRWAQSYYAALDDEDAPEPDNDKMWPALATILGCSEEDARAVGQFGALAVFSFFTPKLSNLTKMMTSSS